MPLGAYEEHLQVISLNASEDYSEPTNTSADKVGLNRFVIIDPANNDQFTRSGNNGEVIGVLTTRPGVGSPGRIGISGIVPVELGADLAAGAAVASDADGRAKAAGSSPRGGRLLQAGVAGEIVACLLG
jgi:hypothetical protein